MPQRYSNSHSNKRAAADTRLRPSGQWDRLAVALPPYSSALSCLSLPLEPGNLQSGKIFSFSKINLFFFKTASHFSSSSSFSFLLVSYSYSSFSPSSPPRPPLLRFNQVREDSESGKKCGHSVLLCSVFPVYVRR
jgi:hypothetical protein